jgi:tetratricopeptide (TPR) repeat protein
LSIPGVRRVLRAFKRAVKAALAVVCSLIVAYAPGSPRVLMAVARFCLRARQPAQALAALARVLLIDPENEEGWRALVGLLDYGDHRLAREIESRARQAGRIETWVAASRTQGRLTSIAEILPNEDCAPEMAERHWQRLEQALTPPELAALATDALRLGRRGDRERLLRRALAVAPKDIAAREALITLLDEGSRREESEQVAAEGVRLDPHGVQLRFALARVQFGRGRFKQAAETISALLADQPNNPSAWFEYGQIARYSYDLPPGTADTAFARAAQYAGADLRILEMVAQYHLEQLNFAEAAKYFERIIETHPQARDKPETSRDYARCLKACGQEGKAADEIKIGLERCRVLAAGASGEAWERVKREEALLLREAGRIEDELAAFASIRQSCPPSGPNFTRPEYLAATPDRLRRLHDIIKSRDLVIFLQGPSLVDFAALTSGLAEIDFATGALGSFPPVEQLLQQKLGRGVDLLLETHPAMVRSWYPELQDFVTRPARNMLLTTHYALSNLQEQGSAPEHFVSQYDERLLFAHPAGGPPLPSCPLHFATCNSLSLLLPLAVIGRPKRIFLVGADGGAHPNFKRPYFFYDDIDTDGPEQDFLQRPDMLPYRNMPERLEESNRRLYVDAVNCDRLVLESFRFLEQVFDVPIPPIFTVCPHSAHRAFPRIDAAAAIAMLREHQA